MCGIAAIISDYPVADSLIKALEKLEYRGYDSAGIATVENNDIKVTKQVGKVEVLKQELKNQTHLGTIGIAHTRWATHGGVSQVNAHPFQTENWCIAHNGIIHNFEQLKTKYQLKTESQTDTEVIVRLLEKQNSSHLFALIDVCQKLKGSYAIVAINKKTQAIYFAKMKSPLFVAKTNDGIFGGSDVVCFAEKTDEFYRLEDNEFCVANKNELAFFDKNKKQIEKSVNQFKEITYQTDKNNFAHYMEKEIYETPNILKNIINLYKNTNILQKIPKNLLKNINRVKFVACGTAYHSGFFGATYFEKVTGIESTCHIASEFEHEFLTKNTLCVFVSQSGETADTISAIVRAKKKKCKTVAITNVTHSTIANMVDFYLPILAGVEIAVASTKAYSAQILVMQLFAYHFADEPIQKSFYKKLDKFSGKIALPKNHIIDTLISHIANSNQCFLLGRGQDYYTAREAALKIKEITYINCVALPSGELKHGTLALVDEVIPIIMFCTNKKELSKSMSALKEIEARGGRVVFLTQFDVDLPNCLKLPYFESDFMPIPAILPIQLCAYKISAKKGINPNKPRNLAKSVTVE